jgi:integrase
MDNKDKEIILHNSETNNTLAVTDYTSLGDAGKTANRIAGNTIFQRYLSEKSVNTIKRHARDLELFAEYMLDIGIMPDKGADFQTNPHAWEGVTWGVVEGFVHWQLREGYAVSSVNARLSTVKVYAQMAVKADAIDRQEGLLIQSVKGFSLAGGKNVDEQREQTRIDEVSYAYKPEGKRRSVVVTRRSTKKSTATVLDEGTAVSLKQPRNHSPQAYRDALLMCLLLDHGLRASEITLLTIDNIELGLGEIHFYRPKVKGTAHEWTAHKMTDDLYSIADHYLRNLYPPSLHPNGPLLLATSRLRKDGEGGLLLDRGLNRVRISERVAWLGKQAGLSEKLSAHDCRHYCATRMARLGYGVDELMAWFGWTSAQTAMRYVTAVDVKERYKG